MNLRKCILTKNNCYKAGKEITPTGVMWHSTGANNPNLKRYVQPDDGLLGKNNYGNDWNRPGLDVCVHAFIGLDKNGNVATYQTLPWNYRGWHAGGSANNHYISFEICEDGLNDKSYFNKVYKEAVELTAYLCKLYKLNPRGKNVIICHQDGYRLGIASNHSDVYHWFKKYGKDMDDVRNDVAKLMDANTTESKKPTSTNTTIKAGSIVSIKPNAKYYNGKDVPDWVNNRKWIVESVSGDRAVIDKSVDGKHSIKSPINVSYLVSSGTKATASSEFKVRIDTEVLNIRKGPGTNYAKTGKFTGKGVFTITETKSGEGSKAGWGKLKSGAGWIALDFAEKV